MYNAKRKGLLLLAVTAVIALSLSMNSYAAGWQQNSAGWWWQNTDTTWPSVTWQWLDGNRNGTAECYYFDADGYMLSNTTTPDGYQVDADGHWIVNGVVQTKAAEGTNTSESTGKLADHSYAGNRAVTGRYDLTSAGETLHGVYEVPIDKTDITAINDPEKFCELMNGYCYPNEEYNPGEAWKVDETKPVIKSGVSNIYYESPGAIEDSRNFPGGCYEIVKVSKSRPIRGDKGDIYEVGVYGFEEGYLLVNTTRNGVYFNERGEVVVNGTVVRHTNYCYYGDNLASTTLAEKGSLYWDEALNWDGYPIFYHTHYRQEDQKDIYKHGFGDCCADIYEFCY